MRKLATARVPYRNVYLISYRVYMKGHLFFITCPTWLMRRHLGSDDKNYACAIRIQSPTRLVSHRDEWLFLVYTILLRDFVLE